MKLATLDITLGLRALTDEPRAMTKLARAPGGLNQSAISNLVDFFHGGNGWLLSGRKDRRPGDIMRQTPSFFLYLETLLKFIFLEVFFFLQ
jgi:hypothetical protein